jgi:hypothetical protein
MRSVGLRFKSMPEDWLQRRVYRHFPQSLQLILEWCLELGQDHVFLIH